MGAYDRIRRGRRADLGDVSFRSAWEANVARWLNLRIAAGELASWAFEPRVFSFPGVTRGAVCYTPDFRLVYPNGEVEYLEVKGREVSKDRTKWKRMREYYPHVKLSVLGAPAYKSLQTQVAGRIPQWEY